MNDTQYNTQEYYFIEQIKTIRNLCDIALMLQNVGRYELLPTILELMQIECQDIVLENCIKDEE